jgi:hypothetical protein
VPDDARIRKAVDTLLDARDPDATICPSEAARALAGDDGFRELMDDVRRVAVTMADDGHVEVTQRGKVVDGRTARGPIRLRRPADR